MVAARPILILTYSQKITGNGTQPFTTHLLSTKNLQTELKETIKCFAVAVIHVEGQSLYFPSLIGKVLT